jgi:hypothetical protein
MQKLNEFYEKKRYLYYQIDPREFDYLDGRLANIILKHLC